MKYLSEQDVLDRINYIINDLEAFEHSSGLPLPKASKVALEELKKSIKNTPGIELEPEMLSEAEWINDGSWVVCSRCECSAETQYDGVQPIPKATKYCPRCGAKMAVNYVW